MELLVVVGPLTLGVRMVVLLCRTLAVAVVDLVVVQLWLLLERIVLAEPQA